MSTTCDKPIFRGNGSISGGPTGHCGLPKDHHGDCKLSEEVEKEKKVLPDQCPYDSWHSDE
jgi:hypothetical protein